MAAASEAISASVSYKNGKCEKQANMIEVVVVVVVVVLVVVQVHARTGVCVRGGGDRGCEGVARSRAARTLHLCAISSPCLLICDQRPKTVKAQGHAGAGCRGHRMQGRRSSGDLGGEGFHDRVNLGLVVDLALRLLWGLQHLGLRSGSDHRWARVTGEVGE